MLRVAVISVHGSPLARLGGKESGGMNVYVRELGRELGRRGTSVDIFTCCREPHLPQIVPLDENARVIHLQAGQGADLDKDQLYHHLPEFLCQLCRFKEANRLQYDLVHSHYWLSGWVASLLRPRWRVPWVAMFHTLGQVKRQARLGEREMVQRIETERRVAASADCIIAASPQEKTHLLRLYGALPHKVTVVPCGVDLGLFKPMNKTKARRALGLSESRIVLFVGRIEPLKGIDILLKAVAQLEEDDLHLLIVGGDARSEGELTRLRRMTMELGIGAKVSFLGTVPQERLPLLYSAADICVVPSYYESFCLVALESLACGTPVIASRVGGLQTTVRDGENGYLIPWRCPSPFAERLELLLGNDTLRRQFGRAGRASVERFRWSVVADRIVEVYDSLLAQTQPWGRSASG